MRILSLYPLAGGRARLVWVGVAWALATAAWAGAQEPAPSQPTPPEPAAAAPDDKADRLIGKTLEEIQFVGVQSLSEDTLRFYLGLSEGEPYDPAQLNENIHQLWQRGLIDDIQVEARPLDWGVRLIITIRERPTLAEIEYRGLERLQSSDVEERLTREKIRVRAGDPLELGEVHRLRAVIEELYAEKGFRLAEVDFTLEAISESERRLVFTVDEGERVRIEDIDFEGNAVFSDARLRWAMKQTKRAGLVSKLLKKNVYDPAALDRDLDKVRELYRRAGYKDAVVGEGTIEISVARPEAASVSKQKRRLAITIPVEEGDRWRLGGVSIEGNKRFSDELLLGRFERPRGGWLRSNVIDDGVRAIEELYSNTGHLFATVEPRIVERGEQVADVVIRVDEGDQFRVGRIEFEGNTKTKDEVLRRELAIQEGSVLDTGRLRASLRRLGQLEYFKVDEEDPVAFDFDRDRQIVDLSIKGKEGKPSDLLFGGGFGEASGFFGQVQYRDRNFLGRGETLSATAQVGERQNILELAYLVPWFLDRPQQVGFSLFRRDLEYNLLVDQKVEENRLGGSLTYGRRLGLFGNLSATWTRFSSDDTVIQFPTDAEPVVVPTERDVSLLRLGFIKDRRDSRLQPTVGGRWSLTLDYAGGVLGGNTNFLRPQATYSRYLGLTKKPLQSLFAVNAEAGYITPLEGDTLFFNDRFFLGGENSVRGFRFKSIWVRDEDGNTVRDENGLALGGNRSLQLNLEYHVLLGGPFRLLAFADGGKVFGESQPLDLDNLRLTTGLELQIKVPILGAPLRLIWSRNLDPLPDDRFQTFQFSIGPSF